MGSRFISDFTTRYMDPTEVYSRFRELAAEFSNIAELITLPNTTNGYQRKAQANMAGGTLIGNSPPTAQPGRDGRAHVARVGPRGRQRHHGRVPQPWRPDSPLSVSMTGNDLVVGLATDAAGALSSTAAQVVAAINATPAASARLVALTYRGNAGDGHRAAAREGEPVRLPDHDDERPRPARAVQLLGDADRQAARRLPGRRVPVLPAARTRVGDAADLPRDRRAAAAQLRDRSGDASSSSTTSTSSSSRRRTRTGRTTRSTTSPASGRP